jgi:hypothetical protein
MDVMAVIQTVQKDCFGDSASQRGTAIETFQFGRFQSTPIISVYSLSFLYINNTTPRDDNMGGLLPKYCLFACKWIQMEQSEFP